MLNCCTANEANVGSQNIYDFFPSFLHNVCFKKAASWLACSYFQLGLILILRRLHIFQNNNWIKLQYFFCVGVSNISCLLLFLIPLHCLCPQLSIKNRLKKTQLAALIKMCYNKHFAEIKRYYNAVVLTSMYSLSLLKRFQGLD